MVNSVLMVDLIMILAILKVTLLSTLMSMESRFSEILPSTWNQSVYQNYAKSMVLLISMAIKQHIKQNCLFSQLWRRLISQYFNYWLQKNIVVHSANLKLFDQTFYHS